LHLHLEAILEAGVKWDLPVLSARQLQSGLDRSLMLAYCLCAPAMQAKWKPREFLFWRLWAGWQCAANCWHSWPNCCIRLQPLIAFVCTTTARQLLLQMRVSVPARYGRNQQPTRSEGSTSVPHTADSCLIVSVFLMCPHQPLKEVLSNSMKVLHKPVVARSHTSSRLANRLQISSTITGRKTSDGMLA